MNEYYISIFKVLNYRINIHRRLIAIYIFFNLNHANFNLYIRFCSGLSCPRNSLSTAYADGPTLVKCVISVIY